MSNNNPRASAEPGLSRRDLLSTAAAATGALVVGFWMPRRAAGQNMHQEGAALEAPRRKAPHGPPSLRSRRSTPGWWSRRTTM